MSGRKVPKQIKQRIRWNLDDRIKNLFFGFDEPASLNAKTITNAEGEETLQLFLYDAIDEYWGIGPTYFVEALEGNESKPIDLFVNSPGGYVWDGRAIQSILARHGATVTAYIDGIAASAATTVVMGADERYMAKGSRFMIHNAWSLAIGNSKDLRDEADLLDKVDEDIAQDYIDVTGKSDEQIKQWMLDETYFSAQEAVDEGFADGIQNASSESDDDTDDGSQNFIKPKAEDLKAMARLAEMLAVST